MKPKLLKQTSLFVSLLHLSMGGAHAATGTWTSTATSGNWADIANWNGGLGPIADDFNSTANFTSNITATTTVSLTGGTDRTIGNIVFSDAGASGSAWIISSSGSEQLILGDNAGATLTPTITATTNATINSIIAGNDGLTKTGAGTLTLNGANTYTGLTKVLGGLTAYSNAASSLTLGSSAKINGNLQLGDGSNIGQSVIKMGAVNQFATTSVLDFKAGTDANHGSRFQLMGFSQTVGGLTSNGRAENVIQNAEGEAFTGSSVLTIDTAGNTYSFGGTIRNKWNSASTGTLGITKTGLGTQTLTGSTTYTGLTTVSGGTLELGAGANINSVGVTIQGSSSTLKLIGNSNGSGTGALLIDGGTFNNSMAGNNQTLSGFSSITMNNGTLTAGVANTSAWGAFHFAGGGTKTITATGTNTISGTAVIGLQQNTILNLSPTGVNDIINVTGSIGNANATTIAGGIAKAGLGTVTLSGLNKYTGTTSIQNGTLSINSIKNVSGGASALGAVTSVANGTIAMGSGTTTGTLQYTGTGDTTDRVINLAGTTGGATLDQSGASGLLKFTSAFTATGVGAKTLTLQGSTTGTGEISGAIVDNSDTNKTSVAKSGTGTWTLSGTNTYTGGTTVSAGKLTAGHVNAFGSGNINVTGGELALGSFDVANAISLNGGKLTGTNVSLNNVTVGANTAVAGTFTGTFNTGTNSARAINTTGGASFQNLTGQATFSGGLVTVTGAHTPGNSPGTQTFGSGLTFANNSTLTLEIAADGSAADLINVTGGGLGIGTGVTLTLDLWGTADYNAEFWDSDHVFTLISANTVTGNFNSLVDLLEGDNAQGAWSSGWQGNDYKATWTAVPEPGAALLGGLGLLVLLRRRRA